MIDDTTTYYVMCEGDPSVGINGQSAEIKVWSADEDQDYTKQLITEMFGKLWDEPVRIITGPAGWKTYPSPSRISCVSCENSLVRQYGGC